MTWTERSIAIDWLRVSFERGHLMRVRRLLDASLGEADDANGLHGYKAGVLYGDGTRLMWGHGEDDPDDVDARCLVECPGGALSAKGPHVRTEWCRQVASGGKVTRIDLAIDLKHDRHVGLIDAVLDSYADGEMCGLRNCSAMMPMTAPGEFEGYSANLGGRTSEKTVCVYDKGLETGTLPIGRWERWEARFAGDAACVAGQELFAAEDFESEAYARALGVVSFREAATGKGRHLDRRALKEWWKRFCDGSTPLATVGERKPRSLDRTARWVATQVAPTLKALALYVRRHWVDVAHYMAGDEIVTARRSGMRAIREQFFDELRRRPMTVPF